MTKVPSDIVLMTKDVTTLKDIARWTAHHSYHLVFIDTGVPFFPFLQSRTQITIFNKKQQTLGAILNETLEYVLGGWLFLMAEDTVDTLEQSLTLLERTVKSVPRLASLTPSSLFGLEQVPHNPLFGTLYSLWAVQNVGMFNPDLDTPEELELDWSEKIKSRGWLHMRMHNQETNVLPMESLLPSAQTR